MPSYLPHHHYHSMGRNSMLLLLLIASRLTGDDAGAMAQEPTQVSEWVRRRYQQTIATAAHRLSPLTNDD